jgi:hypothetical protein
MGAGQAGVIGAVMDWLTVAVLVFVYGLSIVLIVIGYRFEWTGFRGKTVWDWMGLLTAAIVTALVGFVGSQYTAMQAQNSSVESYVDQMTTLFTDSGLAQSPENANRVRRLARARTLLVLEQTGSSYKVQVIQFLHDAHLIQGNDPAISLEEADMSNTDLSNVDLSKANLRDTNLQDYTLDARGSSCILYL